VRRMQLDNTLYLEVCEGLRRGTPPNIMLIKDLPKWLEAHKLSESGLFTTICRYPTDDPYVGGVISDFYLDFDYEEAPDKARKEAVAIVKKLMSDHNISETNIAIAFSGMKGVSVTIDPRVFNAELLDYLPLIWKSIVLELATKLKLKTVDTSIYERRRLWRLLNSKHQKTGLYKIPLTLTELEKLTIDEIKELALKPRDPFIKSDAQPIPKAEKLFLEHKEKVEAWINERKKTFDAPELKTQTVDPPCIKRLLETGANPLRFQPRRNTCYTMHQTSSGNRRQQGRKE